MPNELNLELAAFLEKNISFEPQVTTELEPKKADIERRRQEELKKFGTSEKKTSKYNIKLLGINEYVSRELMELAYSNDWGNNPKIGGAGQTLDRIIERGGYSKEELIQYFLKPEISKINAKYDAELATLETSVESIVEPIVEVKKEKVEIAELNFIINTTSIIDELSDNFIKAAAENNLSGIFNIPEDPSSMIDENIKNQTDKFCGNGNL